MCRALCVRVAYAAAAWRHTHKPMTFFANRRDSAQDIVLVVANFILFTASG